MKKVGIDIGSDTIKTVILNGKNDKDGMGIEKLEPIKIFGRPLDKLKNILLTLKDKNGKKNGKILLSLTGSGASKVSTALDIKPLNEIDAISASMELLDPDVGHVIEIGAETQKYLSFFRDEKTDERLLEDVVPGGKCAGGTGSFLEYMHKRLKYESMDDFIETGLKVKDPASISGRCAVFAESDIVHHYQKGTSRDRIVAGIHQAVARSYKSLVHKSGKPKKKIAMVGGVARNKCIIRYLVKELELDNDQIFVPEDAVHMAAIGAAMRAKNIVYIDEIIEKIDESIHAPFEYDYMDPIKLNKSIIMKQESDANIKEATVLLAAIGVDIGSVSTKAAMITRINGEFKVLASYYRRTEGNPIEAVKDTLTHIRDILKENNIKIEKVVASTTGSGRYLTGYFIGANEIKDEITSQAFGVSTFIKDKDITVIEIGGQDSKFLKLRDGFIYDFEMNWACAAGTGALIEKHAKNMDIDITEFGGYALNGDKPPIINSTCAVFSEAALMYFQQNNISIENLCAGACISSARNYIIKVVRNRQIGEKVAFQGAVAFNKGMVGAFETILDRPIVVPPYPHLTGAIGCARVAYEEEERKPGDSKFRGFDEILKTGYKLTSFICKHCGNECSVNRFVVGKDVFFQGDRCDRYSGAHKKNLGKHLPDLFKEREDLMFNIYRKKPSAEAITIGYPQGLLFNEYYPLFNTFFRELGFNVKTTEATNKKIIRKGIENTVAEPCFPIKVAHGHVADLAEEGADFIFMPSIITAEKPLGKFELCTICPYVQSAPDVIRAAVEMDRKGIKILNPVIYMDRGLPHIERKMIETVKELGKSEKEIEAALKKGFEVLEKFREKIRKRGKEILENLKDDEIAFAIIARPYALYDAGINMNVAKKVQDEGFLAIPYDFLPLDDPANDVSDVWPNIYPAQGQKKVASARFIKNHPNVHALVVTYFGCGPDAFLDQMFHEELNGPYLTMQIDEHTSDTGILTRIQAYLASVRGGRTSLKEKRIHTNAVGLEDVKGKKLWIPYMNEGARLLAGALRAHGVDSDVTPRSGDPGLTLARNSISGDVCIPMLYTTQDMLHRATQPDFDPEKEAFFQGKSGGPCRFGMYYMIEKLLLDHHIGDENQKIDLVTLGNRNTHGGLGLSFLIMLFDSLLAHDMLEKLLHHVRPYEVKKGESDRIFIKYINEIIEKMQNPKNKVNTPWKIASTAAGGELGWLKDILTNAMHEFQQVEKRDEIRPLVGVVGEFFVRLHEPANQNLIRSLEDMNCEIWLAPQTEFFGYSNYITGVHAEDQWKDEHKLKWWKEAQAKKFLNKIVVTHEHKLFDVIKSYMPDFDEITSDQVVGLGAQYVTPFFGGEAILSLGKSEDFARRNLDGIVSVGPFNCMPSLVVSALSRELRRKFNKIPYLNIDFDGFEDNTREQRMSAFISQVKERCRFRIQKVEV
ncbi:MAG: acyl-CoA dehydratase activase [Candidatus Eremiobacteraeota bacterium]|nr:acyl-CoA dehydratase activase [Candidatus Eremiobacteraeota bacterium]